MYLIKCEYRAPFRAFLEAHNAVQRAPRIELVDEYLSLHRSGSADDLRRRKEGAQHRIKKSLEDPALLEALTLEQRCEAMEVGMARAVLPFAELARHLDRASVRLSEVLGVLERGEIPALENLLRRLRSVLCLKGSVGGGGAPAGASKGIRPILLDLQGLPRDDAPTRASGGIGLDDNDDDDDKERSALSSLLSLRPFFGGGAAEGRGRGGNDSGDDDDDDNDDDRAPDLRRLMRLLSRLRQLSELCRARGGLPRDLDVPAAVIRGCASLDCELLEAQYRDWRAMARRQRVLSSSSGGSGDRGVGTANRFADLSEEIRVAEIDVSIAMAAPPALEIVRQRLDLLERDRMKRFVVLEDIAKDVCRREMDMELVLRPPHKDAVLDLPEISALGIFGLQLRIAGEPLPLG